MSQAADELAEAFRAWDKDPTDNGYVRMLNALTRYDAARAVPVWEEWSHGCDALCQNVTFWAPTVIRCPHCGRPAPERAALGAPHA